MLETLISGQSESQRASAEPDPVVGSGVDFQGMLYLDFSLAISHIDIGDTALQAPIIMFTANLTSLKRRLGLGNQPLYQTPSLVSAADVHQVGTPGASSSSGESASSIRIGARSFVFPTREKYASYIDFFFDDINPCHSCVNEVDFRGRSQRLLACDVVDRSENCFLALNYIIFACSDILVNVVAAEERRPLAGWQWFLVADELVGKRKLSGRGDLSLVQFLVYEVSIAKH